MASLAALMLISVGQRAAGTEPRADFVSDRICAGCHQSAFEAWRGSHHDQAMQVASENTVLGDFDDSRFEQFGEITRFFRCEGAYLFNTRAADGTRRDYRARYTFGVDPLQQYLLEVGGGRLQALTIAWDGRRNRWYSLYPDGPIEPGDALHWTGVYQNWNAMCGECHSTNVDEGRDLRSDTFDTTWSEVDVGCQACHGPGGAHVAWAWVPRRLSRVPGRGRVAGVDAPDGAQQAAAVTR